MRVLVTGGTGKVGRAAVERLIRSGHQVKVIGRSADMEIAGGEYARCDVNDYPELRRQAEGVDGIVHLAAIPNPAQGPGEEIFRVNCEGTFNLYQAATEAGIKRVVSASSINALGFFFGVKSFPLRYLPIDEEHPCVTTDPYSFSKQIMEATAAYFWRREGISGVCLRLPGVFEMNDERMARMGEHAQRAKENIGELLELPEAEQRARVEDIWAEIETRRTERRYENRDKWHRAPRGKRMMSGAITNFFASIDARESAQAIEKGLLGEYEGSHPLFVNDSHNRLGIGAETLASLFFPRVTQRKRPFVGTETLVSIDRARQLLDFEPEFSVGRLSPNGETGMDGAVA